MPSQYYSEERRHDSDVYLPEIKRLVIQHLLMVTPDWIDFKHAADLMLLSTKRMTIAARVRNSNPTKNYAGKYPYEFTFRAVYETGHVTELDKVLQGMANVFFYGHGHPLEPGHLARWWLLDLDVFRANMRDKTWQTIPNGDGTFFAPFDVRKFPPELVIDGSDRAFIDRRKIPPPFQPELF
jgi:hypothetical protein